jgi:hypothetical protein
LLKDGRRGWAIGPNGGIIVTKSGGVVWARQGSGGNKSKLLSVRFLADGRNGWAVGENGKIVVSDDGGETWWTQTSGTERDLRSLYFQPDGKISWAASGWGKGGGPSDRPVIVQTLDGGTNWQPLSYAHLPPPWMLYGAIPGLLFAFFGIFVTARDLRNIPRDQRGIEGTGSTDRPIGWQDPDHLQIKPLARSISAFLRHENTSPPLTIAITGEWGKGKSSLMNLIAEDLRRHDARPVWFNAWHHQKENHLLAALLENIRAQAIPGWWRWSGLTLRLRLIVRRGSRDIAALVSVLFIILLLGGLIYLIQGSFDQTTPLRAFLNLMSGELSTLERATSLGLSGGGGLLSLVLLLRAAARLKAISISPARLLATMSRRGSIAQFTDQLGFRYRFAKEFGDICRTLRSPTAPGMVIMIDDLDRCRPESVLDILEAVNFLADAGPCFIFLGIDVKKSAGRGCLWLQGFSA